MPVLSYTFIVQVPRDENCDWIATMPVVQVGDGYSAAGIPVTLLTVRVCGQEELMALLNTLHTRGVHITSIRDTTITTRNAQVVHHGVL